MKKILHFISETSLLSEYKNREDLETSYAPYVDGLEIIRCGCEDKEYIDKEKVIGVHLPFYSDWISYWIGKEDLLKREYGSQKIWEEFYGGKDPNHLIPYIQKDMDYAQEVGAEYVVFHVSNVSVYETFYRKYDYTDEEVIDYSIEFMNKLFEGKNYTFEFLMENLPWPGLRFDNGNLAKKLLDGVKYPKKGFMLDTGHMMQNNLDLETQEEGVEYVMNFFQKNPQLIPFVKGIHLHQSITGSIVKEGLKNIPVLKEDFYEKFAQAYDFIHKVDTHSVITAKNTREMIEFLQPEFLVYEYRSSSRKEREEKLKLQSSIWKG
ncbi:TIM barrel protein [Peptoniphilus sp. KCTC 25270]|uniref:TIM barrel protein n=1 Tax=Peptoniphilus sp. KCTC 25270 TaxID=2897414 RepID=UPI001E39DC1E|nr:TIM barrel protein [Peptoniphilus sp. KCTC 25270]MCD1146811.1 TIM barrel protein [Peptoniphilus sp. KCTC 25270]